MLDHCLHACSLSFSFFYLLMYLSDNRNHLALYNDSSLFPSNLEEKIFRTTPIEAIWEMPAASPLSGLKPSWLALLSTEHHLPFLSLLPSGPIWVNPALSNVWHTGICLPNLPARLGHLCPPDSLECHSSLQQGNSQSLPTLTTQAAFPPGPWEHCSPCSGQTPLPAMHGLCRHQLWSFRGGLHAHQRAWFGFVGWEALNN